MKTYRLLLILFILLFICICTAKPSYTYAVEIDYYEMFDEHGAVMLIIDAETGKIEFANKSAQTFYGYSKETLQSMTIQEINTLTPEEVAEERLAAADEQRNHFIFKHRLASGEIRTVEVYSYPYSKENQTLLFSTIYDITEAVQFVEEQATFRRNVEIGLSIFGAVLSALVIMLFNLLKKYKKEQRLLIKTESKLRTTVSNIQGMVYRYKYDAYWTMEYVSEGSFALTGYRPEELLNNAVVDFNRIIVEDFREKLRDKWKLAVEQNSIFEHEYLIIDKSGAKKWVLDRGQAIYSNDGKIEAIEGIITDISHLKATEDKAHEYYEKLYATLISVGDGVITTDIKGKIDLINPITQALTGWSQEEAYGEDFDTIFHIVNEYSRKKVESPVMKAIETKSIVELANHTLLISRDGEETPIEDTAAPIWDRDGNLIGTVVIFRDNSEKHQKRKEIEYIRDRKSVV